MTTVEGIPVTGLSRTLLDNAAVLSQEGVMRLIHEAEVRRLTDPVSVHDLLRRYPRRQGAPRLRAALAALTAGAGVTRRELERRFADFLAEHRLPAPRRNADIAVAGRFFCGDCVWDAGRLVVELDSWSVHGTRGSFEADKERDRILVAAGWRIIHVTWRQLAAEPSLIAADIRATLGALPSFHGI